MDPLWAELINSDWRDYRGSGRREDRLTRPSWLRPFVARAGWRLGRLPGRSELARLRRLRLLLRRLVETFRRRRPVSGRDLASLNRILAGGAWAPHLAADRGGWRLSTKPNIVGVGRVEAEVAWSFASLLATGEPERVKVCANPDCGWVMYDESRNRSRQWCEARECGNLMKVRRFRQRQRRRRSAKPSPQA